MKHSNRCYVLEMDFETKESKFVEVNGVTVKNLYGFDLFKHKNKGSKGWKITEGKTGLKVCEIRTDIKGCDIISHVKEIDSYLEVVHQIYKKARYETMGGLIEKAIEKNGLSPRYTEPNNCKEKKEKNQDVVLSKCLYEKTKKYFVRIYNQDGIELFQKKSDSTQDYYTVYASCNNWMIPLGQSSQIDVIINKLKEGLDVHNWLLNIYNNQISKPNEWVDLGVADYLGCRIEAEKHNEPIKIAREKKYELEAQEREKKYKLEAQEREKKYKLEKQKEIDSYNTALLEAENKIKNNDVLANNNIKNLSGNESTIILELMKKYNINIPIKTKGWINEALARIFYDNDRYVYSYAYFRGHADSVVFLNYLEELVSIITSL